MRRDYVSRSTTNCRCPRREEDDYDPTVLSIFPTEFVWPLTRKFPFAAFEASLDEETRTLVANFRRSTREDLRGH